MACVLTQRTYSLYRQLAFAGCLSVLGFILVACRAEQESPIAKYRIELPEQNYVSDHLEIASSRLVLWQEEGGCKLQIIKGKKETLQWLKPTGPCYFMKSPGTERVQVYQHDRTTRIVVVVGTPVEGKKPNLRCGRELQGLLLNVNGSVAISNNVQQGSIYCAEQGLDNFQFSLFGR